MAPALSRGPHGPRGGAHAAVDFEHFQILPRGLLPTGTIPVTSVVTSLRYGSQLRASIQQAGRAFNQQIAIDALPAFITERGNPGNRKRVLSSDLEVPAPFLRRGLRFVDTPGIGSSHEHNTAAHARVSARGGRRLVRHRRRRDAVGRGALISRCHSCARPKAVFRPEQARPVRHRHGSRGAAAVCRGAGSVCLAYLAPRAAVFSTGSLRELSILARVSPGPGAVGG